MTRSLVSHRRRPTSVVVNPRLAPYDRPYARRRHRPRTNYANTSTRWIFFVVGFSRRNVNCACVNPGFCRQLDLDIVYIVNSENETTFFVALSSKVFKMHSFMTNKEEIIIEVCLLNFYASLPLSSDTA